MNTVEKIRLSYPLPIAKLYESMRLETQSQLRVRRLVELFEGTVQYLALVGLAQCLHAGLLDDRVKAARLDLKKPSLGHWLALLKAVAQAQQGTNPTFLSTNPLATYRDEPLAEAVLTLAGLTGFQAPKGNKIGLVHFLDVMVQFRNLKIGHGRLSRAEARQVQEPLEAAMAQWFEQQPTLYDRRLLHIAKVEWQTPVFIYTGTNLNAGTSLDPFRLEGDRPLDPNAVYLHLPASSDLISLYPFFVYDDDTYVLYAYAYLSIKQQPVLKCLYDAPGAEPTLTLNLEAAPILSATQPVAVKSMAKIQPAASTPPPAPSPPAPPPAPVISPPQINDTKDDYFVMRNWFDIITPHADIRQGNFDEAVFAADVGDVAGGQAPADYNDPYLFFKKTYLTDGLTNLLTRVYHKLTKGEGSGVVQIQTPFGGGKTHSLVTIYHYLKNGQKVKELLPAGIELLTPKVAVIAGNHWDPLAGKSTPLAQAGREPALSLSKGVGGEAITRRTFWGDVAYQIGGAAGYELFRENDEKRISPGKEKLRDFLKAHQPFVLLFDEILEYINRAADVRDQLDVSLGTQTFSFFQELTEAVATLPQGMLVVTLPSSQLEDFGDREEEALTRLSKIFGRLESIETPVRGEEIYAVIRRRLFEVETLRAKEMRETVHRYFQLYQQHKEDLPAKARDVNYKDRMEMAYPFHPDLIDILNEKWSTFSSFQRTRGVLRLLANVVEDLYQREVNIDIILPGDINLDRPGIRQEFIKHIGSEYEGVISSDIAGHEAKSQALDKTNRAWKHLAQRISNGIFVHSFSADDSEKGITLPYIKLAVLRSDTIPAMVTDVLQKLDTELWYLNSRGDAYYFSRIPNLNRMILDKKELFNQTYEAELKAIIQKEVGSKFTPYLWPDSSEALADNRSLKLVILHPADNGSQIPAWIERKGSNFREYQNTLFFALADTAAFAKMREDVKTYLALQEIESMVKSGEMPQLAVKKDEIQRRLRDIQRDFSYNVRRMYHTLQFGRQKLDLGQPTAGNESMSTWYWRELTDGNVGAIVEQLGYRIIVNKLLAGNDQVAASLILDQFYKNPDLPVPAQPEVVARAIQLGVQDQALGLTELHGDELDPHRLKFGQPLALDSVTFEPGVYLVSRRQAEALLAKIPPPPPLPGFDDQSEAPGRPSGEDDVEVTQPPPPLSPEAGKYNRVRLVISGIPAGKIADVNRGVLLPLSSLVKEMKFTLEIDVTSEEGIPKATLENKIKETIRQIGAYLSDEQLG